MRFIWVILAIAALNWPQAVRARELDVQGEMRRFVLHAPEAARGWPLVLVFHGYGISPAAQEDMTRFAALGAREGFVVAYPVASRGRFALDDDPRDLDFSVRIIDALAEEGVADRRRVYAAGFSMGAQMTWRLACARPGAVAAIGLVSGAYPGACGAATPAMIFHGTHDAILPFDGLGRGGAMAIPAFAQRWSGCAAQAGERLWTRGAAHAERWACAPSPETVLVTINGGGHAWPGAAGRASNHDVSASEELWRFFRRYSAPLGQAGHTT